MIELKRLAFDAMCIDERNIHLLKKIKGRKYEVHHATMGKIGIAEVVPVEIEDLDNRVFLADKVTGSLYDEESLKCYSGPLELRNCK